MPDVLVVLVCCLAPNNDSFDQQHSIWHGPGQICIPIARLGVHHFVTVVGRWSIFMPSCRASSTGGSRISWDTAC